MNRTEHYGLSQWALTDRIEMKHFNADNAIIDAALGQKLELVELMDVTETLENERYWNIRLNFNPGEYFAFFLEYTLPGSATVWFSPYFNRAFNFIQLHPTTAALACFPLRNPKMMTGFLPIGGEQALCKMSNAIYEHLDFINISPVGSNDTLNGTYRLRILGIR